MGANRNPPDHCIVCESEDIGVDEDRQMWKCRDCTQRWGRVE